MNKYNKYLAKGFLSLIFLFSIGWIFSYLLNNPYILLVCVFIGVIIYVIYLIRYCVGVGKQKKVKKK